MQRVVLVIALTGCDDASTPGKTYADVPMPHCNICDVMKLKSTGVSFVEGGRVVTEHPGWKAAHDRFWCPDKPRDVFESICQLEKSAHTHHPNFVACLTVLDPKTGTHDGGCFETIKSCDEAWAMHMIAKDAKTRCEIFRGPTTK